MFTHIALPHLPALPEEFYIDFLNTPSEQLTTESADNYGNIPNNDRAKLIEKNGELIPTRHQRRYNLGERANQWVFDNLFPATDPNWFISIGFSITSGPATIHRPHTDPRRWLLFYLLDSGGPDANTNWWIERDKNIEPGPWQTPEGYSNLIHIERARFPLKTWVLFNPAIIHSVDNQTTDRKNIQLSMNDLPPALTAMLCSDREQIKGAPVKF